MSKARSLSAFISDPAIDASEIGSNAVTTDKILNSAVTADKLHTSLDLSTKTVTFADNHISGNKIHGGVISDFASTGIDDNATGNVITILSNGNVGVGTATPAAGFQVNSNTTNTGWTPVANFYMPSKPDDSHTYIEIGRGPGAGDGAFIDYKNAATAADTHIGLGHSNTGDSKLVVKYNGNVGIGTTSPEGSLHVTGYRDGVGNGATDVTLMLSSTATSAGSNSANGPESLKFKGYGHNYNGDVTGITGSNEINFEMSPTWSYWGDNNAFSPYGQSYPAMDFKTKGSNQTGQNLILRMMAYGQRLVGTMNNGSTDVNRQLTKGAINLIPQLGRYLGSIPNNSSRGIADMLGVNDSSSTNKGVYLVGINGGGNGNARDTGIYLVSVSSAVDIYDSGMLVTEQFNNKGLNQVAAGETAADHAFVTVTTFMRGYDTCYGNCGSFDMDQYGNISTGGAYGGCSVWAIHLIGENKGGKTLWEE